MASRTPFDNRSTSSSSATAAPQEPLLHSAQDVQSTTAYETKTSTHLSENGELDNTEKGKIREAESSAVPKPAQSCDTCRIRKIKCAFPPNLDQDSKTRRCTRCIELEIECSFNYAVKKRGPPKGSVRRAKKPRGEDHDDNEPSGSSRGRLPDISFHASHLSPGIVQESPYQSSALYHASTRSGNSISASLSNGAPSPGTHLASARNWTTWSKQKFTLEQFLDRETVQTLLYLYIDYLWHLTPCFHIPSFLADFARQRDTYDTDFLAVVMALSTFTLLCIPKAWLPFEKAEVYGKVWDCIEGTQAILYTLQNYPPTLSTIVAHYLIAYAFHNLDMPGPSMSHSGHTIRAYTYLRLYDPNTYLALNPIDAEVAKRIHWLMHGSDKTQAALSDCPVLVRSVEYGAVDLARVLDDRYITNAAYLPPETSQPPLIVGFHHITRLFCVLEEVLALYRAGRHNVIAPEDTAVTLGHLDDLLHRNQMEMVNCIPELQLRASANADNSMSDIARLLGFYDQQTARHNAFMVAQANIYCTQALISSLIKLSGLRVMPHPRYGTETLESICHDLLHVLRSIPIECIAANGKPLCQKVRYIVSGLLDPEANEGRILIDTRAQQDLLDFLHLMSEIDKYATLEAPR
ncbi:hypothetical protein NliqN6_2559 [Naganishia liquefaciens]|uniref:Zn(2)-C6 fungal-type domain-containing protein n=1 Tax=Naganishia liquefaciens TaxID=104408 RepID=A0A8H3YFF1_9TREE|nr:hypothetical protein NliqN6_2559 [Naganishia liquefaciens]